MSEVKILGDVNRKSRFNSELADQLNKNAEIESKRESKRLKKLTQSYRGLKPDSVRVEGVHGVMEYFATYYDGVNYMRSIPVREGFNYQPTIGIEKECYIPLNLPESLELLLKEFNTDHDLDGTPRTLDGRLKLLNYVKSTATGFAYSADGEHIKIIPNCTELILIQAEDANRPWLPINYQDIQKDYKELDRTKVKFNTPLTQSEVSNHKGWLAAVGETLTGRKVLQEYSDIVFKVLKKQNIEKGMAFRIQEGAYDEDRLFALGIGRETDGFDNYAWSPLYTGANFLRYRGAP